jgi:transcriptional regulator with XRE-family HTH domain
MVASPRTKWKIELGLRLARELDRVGLNQADLARRLETTRALTNHWTTGKSEISSWDLQRLSKLGIDVRFVLTGLPPGATPDFRLRLPTAAVPLCTPPQLLQIARGKLDAKDIEEKITLSVDMPDRAIAFRLFDRSHDPRYPQQSTTAVVDAQQLPQPGDLTLVALLASDEVLFRKMVPEPSAKPGQPPYELRAENADFHARPITRANKPVLLGTLAAIILSGSR